MEKLLKILTDKEKEYLNKVVKEFKDISDVEDQLADYMMENCVVDDELTEEGIVYETILNKIGNLD